MFAKEIDSVSLATDIADELFPNITGSVYGRDVTFIATLRALLHQRVPAEERVRMYYTSRRVTKREEELYGKKGSKYLAKCFEAATDVLKEGSTGILHIHSVRAPNEEDLKAGFQFIDNDATLISQGYEPVADLQAFMEQPKIKIPARFFIHKERKNTVVFIANIDIKRWHFIQAMIPRYFPWYFAEKPITEEDAALIKSLNNRYAPDYEDLIERIAQKFDFRKAKLRKQLKDFETGMDRVTLERVKRDIKNTEGKIEEYLRYIGDYYRQLEEHRIKMCGLENRIVTCKGGEDSEMMQFFVANKGLHLINADHEYFEFIVTTTIDNYDVDMFSRLIKNHRSAFYRDYRDNTTTYGNADMTDERIEKLMRAIFEKEQLKLRVCAAYRMDFTRAGVVGCKNYEFRHVLPGYKDFTPNQHIQYYGCLGNNHGLMVQSLKNHDYIGAIIACMASAKNMNLSESNTITRFMQKVLSPDAGRFIEMPDGSIKTPLDAVKWLEEEEANGKKKREEEAKHE